MNTRTLHPFRAWMLAATAAEQQDLADRAGTSVGNLRHYASGQRRASAAQASRIERAIAEINAGRRPKLPAVYRTDLADACASCEFAAKCLGKKANLHEFEVVREAKNG